MSTVLEMLRSACCGVSVAVAVLLPVLGSNWSEWVIVGGVRLGAGPEDPRPDQQRLRDRRADRPDGPHPGRGVIRPLAGRVRDERESRGQEVGHPDIRGVVRAAVAERDREGDDVADVGRGVVHGLGKGEVGELRRLDDGGRIVGDDRVELVGVGDRRRVRLRAGAGDGGHDHQRLRRPDVDRPHGPQPGARRRTSPGWASPRRTSGPRAAGRSPGHSWRRRGPCRSA